MEMISFTIYNGADNTVGPDSSTRLFFVLEEELLVCQEGRESRMQSGDLVVVNQKVPCTLRGEKARYICFRIDNRALQELFPSRRYSFHCDSTREISDTYTFLRGLLTDFLQISCEGGEYQRAELEQKECQILLCLVSSFAVASVKAEDAGRAEQIVDYIDRNYQEPLSLEEISQHFHMAPQYFSRYFRKQVGTTYYKYLNGVRMEHAVEDMLNTDDSLIRIAMENGFANPDSFYRYFKSAYNTTPQEYRQNGRARKNTRQIRQEHDLRDAVRQLRQTLPAQEPTESSLIVVDASQKQKFQKHWSEAINLASLDHLSDQNVVEQLASVQNNLHFTYVRVAVDDRHYTDPSRYSFFWEDRKMEYLCGLKLRLWMTVDCRFVEDIQHLCNYLEHFLSYFANRYSVVNVRKWRVELVYNTIFDEEKCIRYWDWYRRLQRILDRFGFEKPVLGAGLALGNWQGLQYFYDYMKRHSLHVPDQTFQVEAYNYATTSSGTEVRRATDSGCVRNLLLSLWKNSPYCAENIEHIYITSWIDTMLETNPLNDTCYRGAFVLKNLIDSFGEVQMMGHGIPLDVMAEDAVQENELFGCSGLLTKHGLCKPSFYAYSFLSRMGDWVLKKADQAIVFSNGDSNYQILCHNCKKLNYRYYLDEAHLDEKNLDGYFADLDPIVLKMNFVNVKNGRYIIKRRSVNKQAGSVKDLMEQMCGGKEVYIHPNDLDYLRQVAVPSITLQQITVKDGTMNLSIPLAANEFAYLHVIYQY